MPAVVADRHAAIWFLSRDARLPTRAGNVLRSRMHEGVHLLRLEVIW